MGAPRSRDFMDGILQRRFDENEMIERGELDPAPYK